jgi:hypothetical protein
MPHSKDSGFIPGGGQGIPCISGVNPYSSKSFVILGLYRATDTPLYLFPGLLLSYSISMMNFLVPLFFSFIGWTGFELRASRLQSRFSTT